jgi:hypothetical protein
MGSASKVILVGATSLIVGIYAVSLKTIQTNDVQAAMSQVNRVQIERVEDAALRVVVSRIPSNLSYASFSDSRAALGGGSYSYNIYRYAYSDYPSVPHPYKYYWSGTVTLTPPFGDPKVITMQADKSDNMGGATKPGFRRLIRGQYQVTKYFVLSVN